MLSYNEIIPKKVIIHNGEPYQVLSSFVFRKQQRKPVNQAKLKNLKTGAILEITFHQPDKAEEADVEKRELKFLYANKGEAWFCPPEDPSARFSLPQEVVGDALTYLKENSTVDALLFDDEVVSISIPIKVDLAVTEAAPAVRGNTAQGATKQVTVETGATITTPLFINEGDVIRINTETGEYVERVEKK